MPSGAPKVVHGRRRDKDRTICGKVIVPDLWVVFGHYEEAITCSRCIRMLGKEAEKKKYSCSRFKYKKRISNEDKLKIVSLYKKKVFKVYELSEIFRIPPDVIREILKEEDLYFFEMRNLPKLDRISILLSEQFSLALRKVVARTSLRSSNVTYQSLVERGIDLVCWLYGVKTIIGPGVGVAKEDRLKDFASLFPKFSLLRKLAEGKGRVGYVYGLSSPGETKFSLCEREKGIRGMFLYYGINVNFVRLHYHPKTGKYLNLGKLKTLSKLSVKEIKEEASMMGTQKIRKFFAEHGFKVRSGNKKCYVERYTNKQINL